MAQPVLSQHQQFTSSSMAGHGNYQQASMIQRNNVMNESGTRSLSTAPKHSINHDLAGTLQYVPGGKFKLVSMNKTLYPWSLRIGLSLIVIKPDGASIINCYST